jgi:flagellin-like hook-associated protein FlgL
MANDNVTLTSSVRTSLLSLQNTSSLVKRTQNRLSTGLKVAGPIDDPVSYFQSKGLSDRAADFSEKKSGIDQGISTLSSALNGIDGVESIVRQLKGLALNAKNATSTQIGGLVAQFNDLRTQINNLTNDATYQGLNLVNGSGETLRVDFGTETASTLAVASVDVTVGADGLNIVRALTNNGGFQVSYASNTGATVGCGSTIEVEYAGSAENLTQGTYTFSYGDATLSLTVGSTNATTTSFSDTATFSAGQTLVFAVATAGGNIQNQARTAVARTAATFDVEFGVNSAATIQSGQAITLTYNGTATNLTQGTYSFSYGSGSITVVVGSSGATTTTYTSATNFAHSSSFIITIGTVGSTMTAAGRAIASVGVGASTYNIAGAYITETTTSGVSTVYSLANTGTVSAVSNSAMTGQFYMDSNLVGQINNMLTDLDTALSSLRSKGQTLGSNVALLQTRLDFTSNYVNTLTAGSGKLTLADLNEEGANLLALQTRQQLGTQALSFAGQAEQSVLSLFR